MRPTGRRSGDKAGPTSRKATSRILPDVFPFTDEEPFPRDPARLTHHSPIFWAENKDRLLRQLLIRDIEHMSRRRLCVYFCSPHFRSSVSVDDVKRLTEIVADDGNSPFDLLLETDGGTTDATEGLVHMLREANRDFRVIVPSRAKSNGTAICLSADRIVMGITSELGPIEPLIGKLPASLAMTPTYKATKPIVYYSGLHAFQQSKKLANDLLRTGMMRRKAKQRAKTVRMLCTRTHFYSHGSVINHAEAKKLGLRVEFLPVGDPLWQRYRLLHAMYEVDSNLTGTAKFFEGSQRSLVFAEEEGENDETVGSGHNE